MILRDLRKSLGDTQAEFAHRYHIPFRTIQNWETGVNTPPAYLEKMLQRQVRADLINRRQYKLPVWNASAKRLPASDRFTEPFDWLKAVQAVLGGDIVFALDSALICEGTYLGRMGEWLVWLYGDPKLVKYNGVCVIGRAVDEYEIESKNGLRFTCFNRTLNDAMANESILDMQGITEALSRYYFTHNESFTGIHPSPEYAELFRRLSEEAVGYYSN